MLNIRLATQCWRALGNNALNSRTFSAHLQRMASTSPWTRLASGLPLRRYTTHNNNNNNNDEASGSSSSTMHRKHRADVEYMSKKLTENATNHLLVYTCPSGGAFFTDVMGVVGGAFLLLFAYSTWLLFDPVKLKRTGSDDSKRGFYTSLTAKPFFRYVTCFIVSLLGAALCAVCFFFTSRSVNSIYLLKGGQHIGVITDGIFGKRFMYTMRLDETSFSSSRLKQATFRNKRHWFFFLMNNTNGVYHEPFIFDNLICIKR